MPAKPIKKPIKSLHFPTIELAGIPYTILPLASLHALCRQAGVTPNPEATPVPSPLDLPPEDSQTLATRLAARRKAANLTQAQLATRAGVRTETVNRIERGHVTPDFATIRKLVEAITAAETDATRKKE